MDIYVGNLPYTATEDGLEELFSKYGPVAAVKIIRDWNGRSKGFGFVEMEKHADGDRAIKALNNFKFRGHPLKVNRARPRTQGGRSQQRRRSSSSSAKKSGTSSSSGSFHNPYTFVPSPPRPVGRGFAGDFDPLASGHNLNHISLGGGLWTGHIPIKLTTVTPLVLLDTGGKGRDSEKEPEDHRSYDVLQRLPESSLRGVLRSTYETVTNSRYGCFSNDEKLTYRVRGQKKKYQKSPEDLLDNSLKPAGRRSESSPADRLFGWVPQGQGDDGGYKSRLRVVCEDGDRPDIVEKFGDGQELPLTILGQPKPAQGRFYVAEDKQGTPQDAGIDNEKAGYNSGKKGLRGRKYYWHHKGLAANQAVAYWNPSVEDRTQRQFNGRYQEYRRPDKNGSPQTDTQNSSITGWIKPGTVFRATLYVQNLQPEEVGALVWLLSLPEEHYFRLGYGKPLGFGSVKLEIDEARCPNGNLPIGTGEDWKAYYACFRAIPPATLDKNHRDSCIKRFKDSMVKAYNRQQFDSLSFISGFLQVLKGPKRDYPIHYPRLESEPRPEGENFRWFVQNEKGKRLALPKVTGEKGLPYQP